MPHSYILLCLQPSRSGGPLCTLEAWGSPLSSLNAPQSCPASPPSSPTLTCCLSNIFPLRQRVVWGQGAANPPMSCSTSRHDSSTGGRRGGEKGGCSSLPAGHAHACHRWLPASHPAASSGSCISWQDGPLGRDPPVHVSKAGSSAGHGPAHTSAVWSHRKWHSAAKECSEHLGAKAGFSPALLQAFAWSITVEEMAPGSCPLLLLLQSQD